MKKILYLFSLFLLSPFTLLSQGEVDDQQRIFYRNEKSIGAYIYSTGVGVDFRFGKRIDAFNKNLYSVDIAGVKHPKEIKTTNPYFPNNRGFVFGKINSFTSIRPGMVKQKELYRKRDIGGIAIRYYYSYGPSLGLLKPIYYEILYPQSPYNTSLEIEKFNSSIHQAGDIYGKASFFQGLFETKIIPGAFFKFGFNFEYSFLDEMLHALEAGFLVDGYIKEIPIMAIEKKSQIFFSMFVCYRFGRIIDPTKRNRRGRTESEIEY